MNSNTCRSITIAIVCILLMLLAYQTSSAQVVNNAGDLPLAAGAVGCDVNLQTPGNQCTLRAAIQVSNSTIPIETILFDPKVALITPQIALPVISRPVIINGEGRVELRGPGGTVRFNGLQITAGSSTVWGLTITNFNNGVFIRTNGGNQIQGNRIGLDITGVSARGNWIGVNIVDSANNLIGGPNESHRNIISGNKNDGILIQGNLATANQIRGNFIGTNAAGLIPLPNNNGVTVRAPRNIIGAANLISGNRVSGILVQGDDAAGNQIIANLIGTNELGLGALPNNNGVTLQSPDNFVTRNTISGNSGHGVEISVSGSNTVMGNIIGIDWSGLAALGNGGDGVRVVGVAGNIIGGTTAETRNVISGNANGIRISLSGATRNWVLGNFIGTDVTGNAGLGNRNDGVFINAASLNIIGGNRTNQRNVISGNWQHGVHILGTEKAPTQRNTVQGNFIGIDQTGNVAILNTSHGIAIQWSNQNVIGGPAAATNIISGNGLCGIEILNGTLNAIQGNFIGTDVGGNNNDNLVGPGNGTCGVALSFSADNFIGGPNTGERNIISNNGIFGVILAGGSTGNFIQNNFIGTDVTGTRPRGNGRFGVQTIGSPANLIGGAEKGEGNLISDNGRNCSLPPAGIWITYDTNSIVEGNFIGTDVSGANPLPNAGPGVWISNSTGTRVGSPDHTAGKCDGACNLISAQDLGPGIYLAFEGHETQDCLIQGNFIGTDITGQVDLGNVIGVWVQGGALNNAIGGSAIGAGNLISGNGGTDMPDQPAGAGTGVYLTRCNTNRIRGNLIGTDATGTRALGNFKQGIYIRDASRNLVGGVSPAAGNVISGNGDAGVLIEEAICCAAENTVQNNYIGTDITGMLGMGNHGNGVFIKDSSDNIIGGTTLVGNVISDNLRHGVEITEKFSGPARNNQVLGNLIGVDANGTSILGNGKNGVMLVASGCIVGANGATGNWISGNWGHGVEITDWATGNIVRGNDIGTVRGGKLDLGNDNYGIYISNFASINVIGGPGENLSNTIAFNKKGGVAVDSGTFNRISVNSILGNVGLGIDLGSNGVTANDNGDVDTGANNLQNFPLLSPVGDTIVASLNSKPSKVFVLEFFANSSCDLSGHGEGQKFLRAINLKTDATGEASLDTTLAGSFITATATDPDGNSSEFSNCVSTVMQLDYGDAPLPYPTKAAANGAYHVISNDLYLGNGVDSDPDGQPDANATGDDNDGGDDEDGVDFTTLIVPGATARVMVTALGDGKLNGWLDFNGDGDWQDGGEEIFTNQPLTTGVNGLSFAVPTGAKAGSGFARFRFSTQPSLNYIGGGPDGEVEDYRIEITGPDTDGDGIPDSIENISCTSPTDADTDDDNLEDGVEDVNYNGLVDAGETDPCNSDSDGDNLPDGWEVDSRLNPLINDALEDPDEDGYTNLAEYRRGTNPRDPNSHPSEAMPWIPLLLFND